MLIKCPDCGSDVSDKAPSCVKCGNPIRPTTIEQTGKSFKTQQLLAASLLIVGMLAAIANPESPGPIALMGAGFTWFIAARIAAWWGHG